MPDLATVSPVAAAVPAAAAWSETAAVLSSHGGVGEKPVSETLAQRAVESVEAIVDAQAASRLQPVPGVSLRFRVGEQELAVRVELRAGEVHTEFRAESSELRHAIAHEWRAMTARADAPVRMLEPVFTSNHDAHANSQSFGQSQQQQHSQHQHAQHQHAALREAASEWLSRGGGAVAAPANEPVASAEPAVALSSAVSSRRLSAVA